VTVVADGEERVLQAPTIIAAHGSWESGHLPSNLQKTNRPGDFFGFKAHFKKASLLADLMPLFVFPGGYGGMVWADQGRLSFSCCIRRDWLTKLRAGYEGSAAGAVFRHICKTCPGAMEAVGNAELCGEWLAAGPIRPGLRPGYGDGVFRVGNLAGESHPIIAEGISMALQSGWLLASELTRAAPGEVSPEQAARRYQAAWRRQFALRIRMASAVTQLAINPLLAEAMRLVVGAFPTALVWGATLSGKTKPLPI
jgi:flavin-dependent dehydrogenase